jgi:hypothetical protein
VYGDLVGRVGARSSRDVAEIERRTVQLMGRLLNDLPRLEQAAPTDIQAAPATSQAGLCWRAVAIAATVAQHDWSTATPSTRPTGDRARGEIAQIAELTEGLAAAGEDLAGHLRAAGRTLDAARLHQACTSGLRVAAAAARQASLPEQPPGLAELAHPPSRLVVIVRRPSHLPEALRRLAAHIKSATHLSPQHVQLIARATATAALASNRVLSATGRTEATEALQAHAHLLAQVTGASKDVASITPSDPAPLAQAQQIYLQLSRGNAVHLSAGDASKIGDTIPAVTRALADRATRELTRGAWLIRSQAVPGSALTWRRASTATESPLMLARLSAAATQAHVVEQSRTTHVNRSPRHPVVVTAPSPRPSRSSLPPTRGQPR